MIKLKKLINEWTENKVVLGKVYTDKDRPPFKTEKQIQNELNEKMSDEKRAFLMLGIWGKSWQVNLNNVLRGINRNKPGVIKKGLKELKILHKKIEEEIEQII
jgi:hypothetical protein|tara:strand:- start:343 stop:651 length:309 start_codon:yes stop_codon:yes gene_type:complete